MNNTPRGVIHPIKVKMSNDILTETGRVGGLWPPTLLLRLIYPKGINQPSKMNSLITI